jgi:hypothetical protein
LGKTYKPSILSGNVLGTKTSHWTLFLGRYVTSSFNELTFHQEDVFSILINSLSLPLEYKLGCAYGVLVQPNGMEFYAHWKKVENRQIVSNVTEQKSLFSYNILERFTFDFTASV